MKKFLNYFISASFLSLILGGVGIYYTVRGSRTHLSMDIAAESNVLDVRHPIPELAIIFQGKDIEGEKANLKILTIRVVNDGEANIHENDFDSRIPFGLIVDGGSVVRAQVVGSNSQYLADNLHPHVQGSDQVDFDKIIFDKGRFVTVEVLVIHPKSVTPQVRPLGKIAGLDQIAVRNSFEESDQQGFWAQVFTGTIAVQLVRAIAYVLLAILSFVIIGFFIPGYRA